MDIKLLKWKEFASGSLVGFADVEYHGLTIKCRVMNGSNGKFVGLPQEKSTKDNKYYPMCRFEDRLKSKEFTDIVLALIDGDKPETNNPDGAVNVEDIAWGE